MVGHAAVIIGHVASIVRHADTGVSDGAGGMGFPHGRLTEPRWRCWGQGVAAWSVMASAAWLRPGSEASMAESGAANW